jgi:hypothetical protein
MKNAPVVKGAVFELNGKRKSKTKKGILKWEFFQNQPDSYKKENERTQTICY